MAPPIERPIAEWQAGDPVVGFALVRRREERQDKGGRSYLDLELADASGAIPGKAWSDSAALGQRFAAGDFVKFRGQVQSYRDQLQVKIDNCRRATAADRADGFDEAKLIPSTREDPAALWARLEALRRRAKAVVAALPDGAAAVVELDATVGGGSVPGATVPSIGVALAGSTARSATSLLGSLRTEDPCVIGRIERDRVVLDLRAIAPEDDEMLVGAVARALAAQPAR